MSDGKNFAEQVKESPGYYDEIAEYLAVSVEHHGPDEGYGVFKLGDVTGGKGGLRLDLSPTGAGVERVDCEYILYTNSDSKVRPAHLTEHGGGGTEDKRVVGKGVEDVQAFVTSKELSESEALDISAEELFQAIGVKVAENDESRVLSGER